MAFLSLYRIIHCLTITFFLYCGTTIIGGERLEHLKLPLGSIGRAKKYPLSNSNNAIKAASN